MEAYKSVITIAGAHIVRAIGIVLVLVRPRAAENQAQWTDRRPHVERIGLCTSLRGIRHVKINWEHTDSFISSGSDVTMKKVRQLVQNLPFTGR